MLALIAGVSLKQYPWEIMALSIARTGKKGHSDSKT